jgi:hypothetical protein
LAQTENGSRFIDKSMLKLEGTEITGRNLDLKLSYSYMQLIVIIEERKQKPSIQAWGPRGPHL